MYARFVGVCALALMLIPAAQAQSSKPLAIINGKTLTEADVKEAAATEFEALETRRLQAEANSRREEHEIIENALDEMVADRLLEAETEKQGISMDDMLATEVTAKKIAPTETEVQNLYNANKSRLANVSLEEGMQQIRSFLDERSHQRALGEFVERLKESYGVESLLEPYRVELEVAGHPSLGLGEAPVQIVEFSDFECPFCRRALPALEQIKEHYGDQVQVVFRQFPLNNIHPRAQKAAEASLCAHEQGQFWTLHDLLFQEPVELEVASLKAKAEGLGFNTEAFNACLDSGQNADRVRGDIRDGVIAGVTGTPALFINGRMVSGAQPFETYATIIDDELERSSHNQ